MSNLPADLPPSMILPPIEAIPTRAVGKPGDTTSVLRDFVDHGTRPWGGEPVPLSDAVTAGLWIVTAANVGFGAYLAAVQFGAAPCSGWPCSVATLGGHPGFLLVLAAACVTTLIIAAPFTRGLTRAAAVPLGAIILAGLCGTVVVAGAVALLALLLTGLAIAGALLFTVIDRL